MDKDYTNIKGDTERFEWSIGRLEGLSGTTRYHLSEEFRNELREIIFVLRNL